MQKLNHAMRRLKDVLINVFGSDKMRGEVIWRLHGEGFYAGDGENFNTGPEDTLDSLLRAAIDDELGLLKIAGRKIYLFEVIHASKRDIRISSYFDAETFFENVGDRVQDDHGGEDEIDIDLPKFEGIQKDIRRLLDKWQIENEIRITPWVFTHVRRHGEFLFEKLPDGKLVILDEIPEGVRDAS